MLPEGGGVHLNDQENISGVNVQGGIWLGFSKNLLP